MAIDILNEVQEHYTIGNSEIDRRKTRKNGWDDVIRAYFNHFPSNWPFRSKIADPVIRTALIEKNSRLLNGKLRGKLVPREGGDIVSAKVNNAILDFQWDNASEGGSMLEKWALMDLQTRLFGASFGLTYWTKSDRYEGNEFKVLNNTDVRTDWTATHIRNAKWVQVTEWKTLEEMEEENEEAPIPIYDNLGDLMDVVSRQESYGERREDRFYSTIKEMKGVDNGMQVDRSFPQVEIVTEYRKDRVIRFSPRHNIVLSDVENPFNHGNIPVVMLRYYPTGDDIYGDIEVEPALPIARAINALLSGFIDQGAIALNPPIRVAQNATARIDTFSYGPNAIWLTGDSVNNVAPVDVGIGQSINAFTNGYSVLKSAFNTAMGETSLGISNIDPFNPDKTATEVRSNERQKLTRDQKNQLHLEDALKDQMMMWCSNNKQFLLGKNTHVVQRIVGSEMIKEFKQMGLSEKELSQDAQDELIRMSQEQGGINDTVLQEYSKQLETPRFPVVLNPKEKDMSKLDIRTKMEEDENGGFANLYVTEEDFNGLYDYIPSVESMAVSESDRSRDGRRASLELLLNPAVQQQLASQNIRVDIKDALVSVLEDQGVKDAEQLFETIEQQPAVQPQEAMMGAQPQQPAPDALASSETTLV